MFNSTVLEVGIGLIFCFCAVSLIVSSINEGLSSFLQMRGKYLRKGIQTLLNEPAGAAELHSALDAIARRAESLSSFVGTYRRVSEWPRPSDFSPMAIALRNNGPVSFT